MANQDKQRVSRRSFLGAAGAAAGLASTGLLARQGRGQDGGLKGTGAGGRIALISDPDDTVASSQVAQWAISELNDALTARGLAVSRAARFDQAGPDDFCILIGGRTDRQITNLLEQNKVAPPNGSESLLLAPTRADNRPVLVACGADSRGLSYALLELADHVTYADEGHPLRGVTFSQAVVQRPANEFRCISRLFASDVEDKPWFNDKAFWRGYLSMLARERFNRFHFVTGLGYDFTRDISDCYLHFAYPFLIDVPGYQVRAVNLPDAERDANLEMLKFISDETAARGLIFQLGLWTHAYQWTNSPNANYTIEGLNPDNHAAYCHDAIAAVLKACPAIGAVTIRTHGESGIAEGSYDLWQAIFEGVAASGRSVEIDLHAKGIDQEMIDRALATGMPVNVSPKFWAEHMGLPYHQAAIRDLEMPPPPEKAVTGFFSKSEGTRRFTRYGYADLFRNDRKYGVTFRTWPGTQRLLLWGSPEMAAAYSRAAGFCGSRGMELMEPLSFKGRKGSGLPGDRTAYKDDKLRPDHDWEKYEYAYRLWGRMLYDPETEPEAWRRYTAGQWGAAAEPVEAALSAASVILPLMTTAHLSSAANNHYWPEMYWNMSLVDPAAKHPYSDSPTPKLFGTVSPADPALFSTVDECAAELLAGQLSAKYSPLEVAGWLDERVDHAAKKLEQAEQKVAFDSDPKLHRATVDVMIQCGLGKFFAAKLRAGVWLAIYQKSGERKALEAALQSYRDAQMAWNEVIRCSPGVYVADVTFGPEYYQRGHWSDRLTAIDEDIERIAKLVESGDAKPEQPPQAIDKKTIDEAMRIAAAPVRRPQARCEHAPPASFRAGDDLPIELTARGMQNRPESVELKYRHVNQAEGWQSTAMQPNGDRWQAIIPAAYTRSPYPLQYFFELQTAQGNRWLHPGLALSLTNQPYYVITHA